MPSVHISASDPLGYAGEKITLIGYTPSQSRSWFETTTSAGVPIADAAKEMKPLDQFVVEYELLDEASLAVVFGSAVNTDYVVTGYSCVCGPDKYPIVSVTCIKPSAITLFKASTAPKTVTAVGGFGIVNKWGATSTGSFISSNYSISMNTLDAMDETSGDFLTEGLYYSKFKAEISCEAYGAITAPASSNVISNPATSKQTREGWQIFAASFWKYL